MDVTVAKKTFLRFVARAQAIADKKSTMPVLSNVLLEATADGQLTVRATDLYLSVRGSFAAEVKSPGSVAVPARELLDRVKAMPDGPLHVTTEGNTTVLKAPGSARRYTLRSIPGLEFPTLPQPAENAAGLTLPGDVWTTLITRTQFSISPDDTRPNLNSALFECQQGTVRMVTTDGHRLSKMELTIEEKDANVTLLLPLKAVTELRRLAEEIKSEATKENASAPVTSVTLISSGTNAFFQVGDALFSVKLVDAQFPSYQQVIPEKLDQTARLSRSVFADALRAVSLASNDRTGGVRLTFTSGVVRITSEAESGDGLDEIPIDYAGSDVTIGFNAKYFLDVLGALDGEEEVLLNFSGELDPAVIQLAREGTDQTYVAVIMPMRI